MKTLTKKEKDLKDEIIERLLLSFYFSVKSNLSNHYCTPLQSFAWFDSTFISAGTECIADFKCRTTDYGYDYCQKNGLFIEAGKFDKLSKSGKHPIYINYLPLNDNEGYICVFDLSNTQFIEKDKMVYIRSKNKYEPRHIIDLYESEYEMIKCNFKELIKKNKNTLNDIYTQWNNNNKQNKILLSIIC